MDFFDKLEKMAHEDKLVDTATMNKLKFESIKNRQQSIKKNKKCIFPNCTKKVLKGLILYRNLDR